jgi:HAD superfamily hydrolase (TIGR01509 family)
MDRGGVASDVRSRTRLPGGTGTSRMGPNIEALIFDVDGTLVDTNPHHVEVWRRALAGIGLTFSAERVACEVGQGGDRLVLSLLGPERARSQGAELLEQWPETYRAYLVALPPGRPRVFPKVRELFQALKDRRIHTALATSNSRALLSVLLERVQLDLPDVIVTGEEVRATKPAPDIVLAAADALGVARDRCAYIGDTPYDAMAATAAGIRAFGVLTGGHTEAALRAAGAQKIWADVGAMYDDLDKLIG